VANPEVSEDAGVSQDSLSARRDIPPLRVRVDQDKCTGDGLCVQYAPDVFEFDVDGLAYVKDDGEMQLAPGAVVDVPTSLRVAVIDAADECPGDCIFVTGSDGGAVAGPDS
jgi:ferredoxin